MDLHRGHLAWIIVIIIVLVIAFVYTGYKFLKPLGSLTYTTTVSGTSTLKSTTTVNAVSTINYASNGIVGSCNNLDEVGRIDNAIYIVKCTTSSNATYGLWVAAGDSATEQVSIVGANGKTYVNQSSSYNCTTFFENFTAPAQIYTITYKTGPGGGSCGNSQVIINGSTTPPPLVVYNYIYNGNFGNGQYTGWTLTGRGFGSAPLNITYADSHGMCYEGTPWTGYDGNYFATTYTCGSAVSVGNITSSPFLVDPSKPFLNFKIISPQNNDLYVELLKANYKFENGTQTYVNGTPLLIAQYNTYNFSVNPNSTSTFANVTIPLTQYINEKLEIRVVAAVSNSNLDSKAYIAVGDFTLANRPNQEIDIVANITTVNS